MVKAGAIPGGAVRGQGLGDRRAPAGRVRAPLPQRDYQPVEVGGDDQSGLAARQREHRAVLIGQHDRARAPSDRRARAGSATVPTKSIAEAPKVKP